MEKNYLFVKSNPVAPYTVKEVIGVMEADQTFGSAEDGSTPLPNGMVLDHVLIDYDFIDGDQDKKLFVDDAENPSSIVVV